MDAGEQADEIVLAAEREHRVDQVVADAGFALLDLEAVGEEVENALTIDPACTLPMLFSIEIMSTQLARHRTESDIGIIQRFEAFSIKSEQSSSAYRKTRLRC